MGAWVSASTMHLPLVEHFKAVSTMTNLHLFLRDFRALLTTAKGVPKEILGAG